MELGPTSTPGASVPWPGASPVFCSLLGSGSVEPQGLPGLLSGVLPTFLWGRSPPAEPNWGAAALPSAHRRPLVRPSLPGSPQCGPVALTPRCSQEDPVNPFTLRCK